MKSTLTLLLLLSAIMGFSQPGRINLTHKPIYDSGVSANVPDSMPDARRVPADDSSMVYMQKYTDTVSMFTFMYVIVKFKTPLEENLKNKEKENMLKAYLEFLKDQFLIEEYWGFGSGYTHEKIPGAFAVIDFWKDEKQNDWAVKAWITKTHIAVMMVYGKGDYPVFEVRQSFFDGVRF
ncbi:MAG: hypothetical protein ACOZCO_01210 [Bacteroidota bacterium]